jgi:hypothetical protein
MLTAVPALVPFPFAAFTLLPNVEPGHEEVIDASPSEPPVGPAWP